jgi:sn-glycerol 3-phosphate transport system permease protein
VTAEAIQAPGTPQPAPRRPRRSRPGSLTGQLLGGYLPLILATLVVGLPLLWMIVSSFKQRSEIISVQIHWLPAALDWSNYATAFQDVPFVRVFFNSVIVTVIGAGLKVILAIITAYALVFVRFPFKKVIFMLILVGLMVPAQISIVPNYTLVAGLGGKNTYWGIILPTLGTAFGTFLLRQQFLTLPMAIMEAAEIDGASHWKRMTRVTIPMRLPAIATLALIYIVLEWNEYLWPLVIVPILVVFVFLQKHIVTGLTQGAVKG